MLRFAAFRAAFFGSAVASALVGWVPPAQAEPDTGPALQTSSRNGVTIFAMVQAPGFDGNDWSFRITVDVQSHWNVDDLAASSVLIVDGMVLGPGEWIGSPPGGHYREGFLVFASRGNPLRTVELRIQRPNEPEPRVFRWDASRLTKPQVEIAALDRARASLRCAALTCRMV